MRLLEAMSYVATTVTAIIAGFAVFFGLDQLKQVRKQRQAELAQLYIGRYWCIIDDHLLGSRNADDQKAHKERYLMLCEDEYEATQLGWLDHVHFAEWHRLIVRDRDRIVPMLDEVDPGRGKFAHLRKCLAESPTSDHAWSDCPEHSRVASSSR